VRVSKFAGSFIRDTRDDLLDPSRGSSILADADVAARAIGSQVGFVRTFIQAFIYKQLPTARRIVAAFGARAGVARGFVRPAPPDIGGEVDDLPASERFFTGGDGSVRGFSLDRLANEETISSTGFPVGGNGVIVLNGELRVNVIGLQAVGLILIIALLIIPPAAARFWTDRLSAMVLASAAIGAVSGLLGAALSALVPRLPAGAIIVVVASVIFVFSMIFGPTRGVLRRFREHQRLSRKVSRQHLLRAIYETAEGDDADPMTVGVPVEELLLMRSWSTAGLRRALRGAERAGLLFEGSDGNYRLTDEGMVEATSAVRNHRLWEAYLVTHADIAPSHVDRDADQIEHVLGRQMIKKLEAIVAADNPDLLVPPSPHVLVEKRK